MWMNEHEIRTLISNAEFEGKPVALEAARLLQRLVDWTNAHSDGWPYWRKPSQAADRLMQILYVNDRDDGDVDVTESDVRLALRPIKAFITRQIAGGGSDESDRLWILEGKRPEDVI